MLSFTPGEEFNLSPLLFSPSSFKIAIQSVEKWLSQCPKGKLACDKEKERRGRKRGEEAGPGHCLQSFHFLHRTPTQTTIAILQAGSLPALLALPSRLQAARRTPVLQNKYHIELRLGGPRPETQWLCGGGERGSESLGRRPPVAPPPPPSVSSQCLAATRSGNKWRGSKW